MWPDDKYLRHDQARDEPIPKTIFKSIELTLHEGV
jgi:hypothetical protein